MEKAKQKKQEPPKGEHKSGPKIDPKESKINELTDSLQRLQAEFENFKKRNEKESIAYREFANAAFSEKLLPVIDAFQLALNNIDGKEFAKGIELIYSQLYEILEKEGVRPIKIEGELDPYKHEVLLSENTDNENEDQKIIEELQTGYMFKDKVLRYSKVKVKKYVGKNNPTEDSN